MSVRFVGREQQLKVVREHLLGARAGRPAPLLVTGESGVGKSMFLDHVATAAGDNGFRVFRLDGDAPGAAGSHRALRAAVARWAKEQRDAATAALALQLASATTTPARRVALVDALQRFFEAASADAPVLLALDDLHLADDDTADVALFLMRHLRRHRVLVLATWRTDGPVESRASEDLERAAETGQLVPIALGPFDDTELAALVHARTGTTPTTAFVEGLRARTGGLPFFAAELVDAVAAHPSSAVAVDDVAARPLPRRVATTVLHRVFVLGPDARQLATVLALLGWVGVDRLPTLAAVTRMTEQRAADAFDRLVRARVLAPDGDRYRFTHAIVRDALLADTHPARRRHLHRHLASVLAAERDAGGAADIEEIADHVRRGVAGHDRAAARLLVEAGDAALSEHPAAAVDWYREALVRLPADDPEAAVTQVRLSRALGLDGRHVEAGRVATAAVATLPPGTDRAAGIVLAAHAALVTGRRDHAAELLATAPLDGDRSADHHAVLRVLLDAVDAAPTDAVRMVTAAIADGAPGEDPTLLGMLADAHAASGDVEAAAALTSQLRAAAPTRSSGARRRAALHACLLSAIHSDPRDALADVADIGPGAPMAGWFLSAAAWAHLRLGHLDDAVAAGEAARRCIDPTVGDLLLELCVAAVVIAHLERDEVAAAADVLEWAAAVPLLTPGSGLRLATARLHAAGGEPDRAIAVLREAIELETAIGRRNVLGALHAALVELALAADDEPAARRANARLQALPRSRSATAMNMRCVLSAAMCERRSDLAVAAHHHATRHGLELDAARALALDGAICGDAELLTAAHTALARLGAVARQRQVAAQLQAVGRRPGRDRDPGVTLSASEAAVAVLVAEGLTNRQVGARLGLSAKTIEVYLSRIYAKTGCRSRVELAVAVRDGTLAIPA